MGSTWAPQRLVDGVGLVILESRYGNDMNLQLKWEYFFENHNFYLLSTSGYYRKYIHVYIIYTYVYVYIYISECICRDESRNGAYPEVS